MRCHRECGMVCHLQNVMFQNGAVCQFCFLYNIHSRSGLSFFISVLSVLSAPLQTFQSVQREI